jgi:hypothetical protein
MPGIVRSAWALPVMALAVAGTATLAQSGGSSAEAAPATVTVDFDKSRGTFVHPERYNNVGRARRWVEQRDADVAFFNDNGLHGNTYRVWVDTQLIHDPKTGAYDYSGITDYLADLSRLSDNLLVVMDTRVQVRDAGWTPEQVKPVVKTITKELKRRFPQIKYIEAFNEPDHNLPKVVTPSSLYDHYMVYYQAINEINRELKPKVPLQIGAAGYMQYNEPWVRAFLDRYKDDPSPDKKLDFFSWHGYGRFPEGTGDTGGPRAYHFYKTNPSEVANERARFDAELRSRGLPTTIPAFITETGIYPGPSFDTKDDPRPDYLIGAAGVPALHYWYIENPNIIPFNWVIRHGSEERKDQLITRAGPDKKTPLTNTFSPYGNAMAMMAKLKDERVVAQSSALKDGQGVYAIATKDRGGAAVMVWNYQHTNTRSFRTTIDFGQLPPTLRGKPLRQRMYRIDDKLSNYWANPATANLQQVSDTTVQPRQRHTVNVDLTPNALQVIVLEPAGSSRKPS